jgi:hypothetical protein
MGGAQGSTVYNRSVSQGKAALVDIVRDFLEAHQLIEWVSARYAAGELRFEDLEGLVGDGEKSVLFRLKERCHALFRPGVGNSGTARPSEALFDLAIGSLFHEAMKFRENFYQREVYGPRMRSLRSETGGEAEGLFREFERIMAAVGDRLDDGIQETLALVEQTREPLRVLLAEHRENGFAARYLIENPAAVKAVYAEGIEALLAEVYGSAASGYEVAGRSYLASGFYELAEGAIARAIELGCASADLGGLRTYAQAMGSFFSGDYGAAVDLFGAWLDASKDADEGLVEQARAVLTGIGRLAPSDEGVRVKSAVASLIERIAPARGSAPNS